MANTLIQILRSYTTEKPLSLQDGELAYSFSSEKLFVGNTTNGVVTIGGQYYTDIIDAATNLATPNTLVLRDSTGSAVFTTVETDTLSAINSNISGNLSVTGTTSLTGNVISTLNVTGNVNSEYTNTTLDSRIGRNLYVIDDIVAGETISANNVSVTNDLNVSRDATITRNLQVNNNLNVLGDFSVQGNVTSFNTETIVVEDKNIQLANTATPSNITADGGGITLLGDTNKTFNWYDSTGSWTSSENIDIASGKVYKIGTDVILANNALTTPETTFSLVNSTATTVNAFGDATSISVGSSSGTFTLNNPNIVGQNSTQNVFNTVATTVNAFGSASGLNFGATTGTLTINNPTVVGYNTTQNVFNTVATTVNAFGAASTLNLGDVTGTTNIRNNLNVDGNHLTTSKTTFNIANTTATTINFGGDATIMHVGSSSGNTFIHNSLTVDGNTELSNLRVTGYVSFVNPLEVISGGTGISYANTNGIIFGNGYNGFQVTAQGVEGNVLQVNASNVPYFGMLDGGTF